jgi:hypothetical protein
MFRERDLRLRLMPRYFGGAGVNTSRFWLGSGLGLGFGAFFASLRPLSLLPMNASLPQFATYAKGKLIAAMEPMDPTLSR